MTTQTDLFNQPAAHGFGQRQTDIEQLIAEKQTPEHATKPFPGGGVFWVGQTWAHVIEYYAQYMAKWPNTDGAIYQDNGRLFVRHYGGRSDPTLRQVIPKCLERYALDLCAKHGSKPEPQRS